MIGCCEKEAHDCCLTNYGVFYFFSNVWWDRELHGGKRRTMQC